MVRSLFCALKGCVARARKAVARNEYFAASRILHIDLGVIFLISGVNTKKDNCGDERNAGEYPKATY